jgi:hypothetical protein
VTLSVFNSRISTQTAAWSDFARRQRRPQPVTPALAYCLVDHAPARGAILPTDPLLRYRQGHPLPSRRYDHLWKRLGERPLVTTQGISTHWLRALERCGSSTVNPAVSRITCCARSWQVTSHPFNTGIQDTGSPARNRANTACGSASSSVRVADALIGNFTGPGRWAPGPSYAPWPDCWTWS